MESTAPNLPSQDLSQQAERDRRLRAARLDRLRQELLDRPLKMKQPRIRLQMANNLWKIVEVAQNRTDAATRSAVLHEAGFGRKEEYSKRAPQYFCDPTLPLETKLKRAKSLTQDPRGYVKLARAAARLAGEDDEDAFLLDLVSGTNFAAEVESDLPAEDPQREAWATLQESLQRQARTISEKFDLQRYFIRQQGWGFRYKDGKFQRGGTETEEPSAFLGWVDVGRPRNGMFCFRHLDPREAYESDCTADDVTNYEDLVRRKAFELPVEVHTVLVLHLVLAPNGIGRAVVPCLRARCVSYITAAEYWNRLESFTGKAVTRGQVIAICHRGIATSTSLQTKLLPESLLPALQANGRRQRAPEREFEISETELVFRDMEFSGYGFEYGDVKLRDEVPGLPASLASDESSDRPRIILPLGEEALSVLSLQVSAYMAERTLEEARSAGSWSTKPVLLTALTEPLFEAWLAGNDERRKEIGETAKNPTPFQEGTMLAALDRACQSAEDEVAPPRLLWEAAHDLTVALANAIAVAEATRDANLRKSL